MKKFFLIVSILLLVIVVVGGVALAALYTRANAQYGISEAPTISHEEVAPNTTKVRVLIKPDLLVGLALQAVPPDIQQQIPSYLKSMGYSVDALLPKVLPREIAVWATPNLATNKLLLTIFVNERRGGPFLALLLNDKNSPNKILETADTVQLVKRGDLEIEGNLPIPDTVQDKINKKWKQVSPAEPMRVDGTHQFEAVIDNRNGDILTIAAAIMAKNGRDWQELFADQRVGPMIDALLPEIIDLRVAADLNDFDTAKTTLRIDATADKGPGLEFMVKMVWPMVVDEVTKKGLKMTGEPAWDPEKKALIADLTITGIKPLLEKALKQKLPGPTTANTAP